MNKRLAVLLVVLWVCCGAITTLSEASPLQLKINTISATNSPWHKAMLKFADSVKSKSQGKIEVLVYADGQLGDISKTLTAMQMGTIDMGYFGLGSAIYLKSYSPLAIIYVPYLFKDKSQATRILNSDVFQGIYEKGAQESGVRIFFRLWRSLSSSHPDHTRAYPTS